MGIKVLILIQIFKAYPINTFIFRRNLLLHTDHNAAFNFIF